MTVHAVLIWGLLCVAAFLVFFCAVGVAAMREPYQRLHYIAPPTIISAVLITLAVWADESQKQAGLKAILVTLVLIAMNGVVTHATARAARIREFDHWRPLIKEKVPIVGEDKVVDESEGALSGPQGAE